MRGGVWRTGLLVLLLLAACAPTGGTPGAGGSSGRPSGPGATGAPTTTPKPPPPSPTVTPGPTAGTPGPEGLQITVDDGSGGTTRWRLTCDPPGGDHPDPEAACAALDQRADALAPVAADRQCTQQFGGPQTATVVGTWRGEPVSSRFSLTNGCEIGRWTALQGLLPPAGA